MYKIVMFDYNRDTFWLLLNESLTILVPHICIYLVQKMQYDGIPRSKEVDQCWMKNINHFFNDKILSH